MLADDVLAAAGGPWDRQWAGIVSQTANMIATAMRFSVAQEVILSADALRHRPLAEQLRAMAISRLPASRCWFEWRGDGIANTRCGVLVEIGDPAQPTLLPMAGNTDPRPIKYLVEDGLGIGCRFWTQGTDTNPRMLVAQDRPARGAPATGLLISMTWGQLTRLR
jgi:hypothetical protein